MNRRSAFARGLASLLATMLVVPLGAAAYADEATPAEAAAEAPAEDAPAAPAPDAPSPDDAEGAGQMGKRKPPAQAQPWAALAAALPGGAKSGATAEAIPLPKAEGSITGMGESFSPDLSTGAASYSIPLEVVPGRAGVQPSLGLSYSSAAGNGPLGMGWSLAVAFIARQSDRGMPRYHDAATWTPEEDRFFYNGGQELVPVDSAAAELADCGAAGCAPIPAELAGWQQYRARVEGTFTRFFRSPDARRWVVQAKDGTRYDLGQLSPGDGPPEAVSASVASLESEDAAGHGRVVRWNISRAADAHGSTIYYQHSAIDGQRYLTDIFYTSPQGACGGLTGATARTRCQAPLADYGRRIRLVYEARPDVTTSYRSGWAVQTSRRLKRIEMTSAEGSPGRRTLVRRYHLKYDVTSYWSLLASVQLEGRPQHTDPLSSAKVGDANVLESALGDAMIGATLPPVELHYQQQPQSASSAAGLGGVDAAVHHAVDSPPYSVGGNADLFDMNSDGLPDLVVTDPARFHTAAGAPAVGVFWNGFSGAGTLPAATATFSAAVAAAVSPELSQILRLTNLNLSPMDVDGDGRADYLHMPRQPFYGYFTPVRTGAPDAATPAQQGWEWAYLSRGLPPGDPDPRIDFAHDSTRLRQFDVNGDHLVDIVRTTGTSIQVWLNLGWLPGGDGRYGSYRYDASTHAFALSTAPIETCLPVAGTPVDFGDPQMRLGDMNGDGITDLVSARAGRVIYWPGRGEGAFGTGDAACTPGLVQGRYVEMAQPPTQLNAELADVYLADLNADGVDDIVQVRYSDVDVWFNYGGSRFSARVRMSGAPYAPAYDSRVRLVDVDGSGTVDVLYARAGDWQWIDAMGGHKPRLLVGVDGSLGAHTDLVYESSSEDYLRDLAEASACTGSSCEAFLWSGDQDGCDLKASGVTRPCARRSGGSPVLSTVVREVTVSDRLNLVGGRATTVTDSFRYHDGYYEGIEQEFRGFGATDAIAHGDASSPTRIDRTYMHQGRRRERDAASRLVDNPDEALKGAAYLSESSDEQRTFLESMHTSYTLHRQLVGLSGVAVTYAFASQSDTLLYDTASFQPGSDALSLPSVLRADGSAAPEHRVRVRGASYAHLRSTIDSVDGVGQALQSTAYGRIRGEQGETPDERIATHETFTNVAGSATGWMWRTKSTYVDGAGDPTHLGEITNTYSPQGDTTTTTTTVTQTFLPSFDGDAEAEGFGARAPENLVRSGTVDAWGSPLVTCDGGDAITRVGCLRLGQVAYDDDYALTALTQTIVTAAASAGTTSLETRGVWDRGFLQIVDFADPGSEHTLVLRDGLGRLTLSRPPDARGCSGQFPATRLEYLDTQSPTTSPMSRLHATTFLACASGGRTLEAYDYIDGMGRTRASLAMGADETTRRWVKQGVTDLDARGAVRAAYQADFFAGDPADLGGALAAPALPPVRTSHDAFGRKVLETAEDGAPTRTLYHALGSDVWDAQDLGFGGAGAPSTPHFLGTPTTTRTDGHGRPIDQILRNRQPGSSTLELTRLFSTYRADGALVRIERAQTNDTLPRAQTSVVGGHLVARTFYLDSVGRRVAATDPNTDNRTTGATWRYLYNRVGDTVAVRDPRGCGQNFYYDLAGRNVGETYVGCSEAQVHEGTVATLAAGAVGWTLTSAAVAVDTRKTYDDYSAAWSTTPASFADYPADAGGTKGRLTSTIDRGRRSLFAYDRRGNTIWEARQLALIMPHAAVSLQLANPGLPGNGDALTGQAVVFDAAHTYVRSATVDHANRPTGMVLPADPDFPAGQVAPRVAGKMEFDRRGLPGRSSVQLVTGGSTPTVANGVFSFGAATVDTRAILASVEYTRDGLMSKTVYGDDLGGTRTPTQTTQEYDLRRRPVHGQTLRVPTAMDVTGERPLAAVSVVHGQDLHWDSVSNLFEVDDTRIGSEWPEGHRPQSKMVTSDALYRVVGVDYAYTDDAGATGPTDVGTDWRAEQLRVKAADPMRQKPAPMIAAPPAERVASQTWQYDWLGNTSETTDDAHAFFERSLGSVANGSDLTSTERPSALYLAADLAGPPAARGGYVELDYGVSGNVVDMTTHAQCTDAPTKTCSDPGGALATRRSFLKASCTCQQEQYYQYRWDEVNRLAESRRYDRSGGTGLWNLKVRQRYRYDGDNVRTVKHTIDQDAQGDPAQRYALYVYPGDVERRGLTRGTDRYQANSMLDTETDYNVSSARVVWQSGSPTTGVDADHRISVAISDLIGSTSAVIDLRSAALTQYGTYYPNGGRETSRGAPELVPFEPAGFTGKEDDQEVGLVYFGERYLVPGLGRWLSPDPLEIHSMGGGETLNAYHYVAGNILQLRDALGLSPKNGLQGNDTWVMSDEQRTATIANLQAQGFKDVKLVAHAVYFRQSDNAFKNHGYPYNNGQVLEDGKRTRVIGYSGCAPTAMAMLHSTISKTMVYPDAMADYSVSKGTSGAEGGNGTHIGDLSKIWAHEHGYEMRTIGGKNAADAVSFEMKQEEEPALVSVGPGHFTTKAHLIEVVGSAVDANGDEWFIVNDPATLNNKHLDADCIQINPGQVIIRRSVLETEMKHAFIVDMFEEDQYVVPKAAPAPAPAPKAKP